jgi:hypothetical protein
MGTISACKILKWLCAIVIVLMIVLMVFSLFVIAAMGKTINATAYTNGNANSASISPFIQVLGTAAYFSFNIAIVAIFWKIYKDCDERQDVLVKHDLPSDPKKLDERLTRSGVVTVSAPLKPVEPEPESESEPALTLEEEE